MGANKMTSIAWLILLIVGIATQNALGNFEVKKVFYLKDDIKKIDILDVRRNGVKDLLFIHHKYKQYEDLSVIEWVNSGFKKTLIVHETQYSLDFNYFDYNDMLVIERYNLLHWNEGQYHKLVSEDRKFRLKELNKTEIPSWDDEKYITSGSFRNRHERDVIITSSIRESPRDVSINIRESTPPYKLLWKSSFIVDKQAVVPVFGKFRDNEIELLIATDSSRSYWIQPEGSTFVVTEIKSYADKRIVPLFLLDPSRPMNYLRAGHTSTSQSDDIFFISRIPPFSYGKLFKATWHKDNFESKPIELLRGQGEIGYDNLNLVDIDKDGSDEIVVSGVRGDVTDWEEELSLRNRRDVVHIIRWNGKEYVKMWTSKPLGEITQVFVDDITGDGKKEIIVGNAEGEIHIFGQK